MTTLLEVGCLSRIIGFTRWFGQAPSLKFYLDCGRGRFPTLPKNSQETSSPRATKKGRKP
ncbi:hypothetical protein PviCFBP13515_14755 [Pseudomonas viridiflava]|uniref:Uncharacterized protein n=1 Tax=Pseudomonas viridiflava TaxID=33069 RepID=A0AA46ZYG3_PSEVI|nr:hypothetical protein PviCFBP13507_16425 [Pseudomonas viridiflava]TKK26417.1 hypothetical protein PviCFBP13515_14755 [Pseudomonas viridiflava]UZA71937.1 hypothetical protein EZZ81_22720 [Pseudomonas viridiflava]